mgnify:CR=1 FL=1
MTTTADTHTVFRAEGFSCPSCVGKIEKQIGKLDGVKDVTVKFASGRVEVDHDAQAISADQIASAITRAGYPATVSPF